jgi:adenine/guanine phosphoribosyltransferase-like PRPP-binding protein/signal transduction histidine kinase
MDKDKDVSIDGNLCLGKYPSSLPQLPRTFESLPSVRPNPIAVNSSWFDLTMLSYLAMLIRSCKRPEADLTFKFEDDKRYSFLWRSGFFSASRIGHRSSPFKVAPDIWRRRPSDLDSRANFTPLIALEINPDQTTEPQARGYSELAKDAANSLLMELEKTNVYSHVERSGLMGSKEYLHIVLWELVQNVIDHAKAAHVIIAAQVFYKGDSKGDPALSGLRAQHGMEEQHCELPLRKIWLKDNRERDYLMLSCVDNGIGIPASIRLKNGIQERDDKQLLDSSFQRESSDHDTFDHRYAIHGLHLIAQLVSSYQGYLFAQSGTAFLEVTQQHTSPSTLPVEMALPGTAFQILLPLTAGEPRPYIEPPKSHQGVRRQHSLIYATEELRKRTFRLPPSLEDQQAVVDDLVRTVSQTSGTLFLDFMGMPRERHFTSLLLLCVRRKKTEHPVVILNASEELFTAIGGLRSPTSETTQDEELQKTDRALATDLTRGEGPALLPLVVAVTRIRDASKSHSYERLPQPGIAIQWLGIADDGPRGLTSCLVALLDELFRTDGAIDESFLEDIVVSMGKPEETARALLRNTQRANPNLLFYASEARQWHLAFNASSLYFDSVESLTQRLHKAVESLARFDAQVGTIFYLNWRSTDSYLRNYYQLWPVVRDPELARIAATLLLRLAHDDLTIGPQIAQLGSLVSVTASAGLLAREIARILRIPHWEVPSVYDLSRAEWPQDFAGDLTLIVDDLIDTGTASRMVIEELVRRNANCAGVLSVLASIEGREARKSLTVPIISLMKVELGRPTQTEINTAEANDTVLDVDPHTLEPTPRKQYGDKTRKNRRTTKNDLLRLAHGGGLRSGHFVYGGHHYYEFFDIVRFMDAREGFEDLWSWFKESVSQWHSRTVAPVGKEKAPVAIIYPYYSPIAAFLHRIHALLPTAFTFPCSIHVARPYQRSRQRIGYRLDTLGANDRFAVFVDDGIASGGTLSEVVDEFVSIHNDAEMKAEQGIVPTTTGTTKWKAAILALPVFDRIGMTPRKHLKSIEGYHGSVRFEFEPKYSLNLRAYYAKDCPLCRIDSDIGSIFRTHGHVRQQLETTLGPVRHLLRPTYLTAVATRAPTKEMKLQSNDDTATVVYASDALFSDLASGSEIKKSICDDQQKSSIARLEILLNVMMDPILYRSVHDETFFVNTITNEFWRGGVSSEYRSFFLMHMPYLHSRDLAQRILLKVIPESLRAKSEPVEIKTNAGFAYQTPTHYFDEHPEVFATILAAIWVLSSQKEKLPGRWDSEWHQTLRETPYRHQFVCSMSSTHEDVARASAEMLLCNFVTHYRYHREALQKRLEHLRTLIDTNKRAYVIPRHTLVYLMNAIKMVRDYYVLEDSLLTDDITAEILSHYDIWFAGDNSAGLRLRNMLVKYFAPEQGIHVAMISQYLLDGLASTVDDIIVQAKNQFASWLQEQACKALPPHPSNDQASEVIHMVSALIEQTTCINDAEGARVFGNKRFIIQTVAHLLRNPFESGIGRGTPLSSTKAGIVLSAKKTTNNGRELIRVSVTSAEKLTQDEVERCFRAGGGLMAQKQENKRWGGEMGGHPTDDGRTVFFLDLETISMDRKGKV